MCETAVMSDHFPVFDPLAGSIAWLSGPQTGRPIAMLTAVAGQEDAALMRCLAPAEGMAANRMEIAEERRHFLVRRVFQRSFVRAITGWLGPLNTLTMIQERDSRPRCVEAPAHCLSFSSSGAVALACASASALIGVDIERLRPVPDAIGLARRFFTAAEAGYLGSLPLDQKDPEFQRFWSAKEACLKAAGQGAIYGLDQFAIIRTATGLSVAPPAEFGPAQRWSLETIPAPQGYIAMLAQFRL